MENDVIAIEDCHNFELLDKYGLSALKNLNEIQECKSVYFFAIRNIDNKFMGGMTVHFKKHKRVLTSDELTSLEVCAAAIGSVLDKDNKNIKKGKK